MVLGKGGGMKVSSSANANAHNHAANYIWAGFDEKLHHVINVVTQWHQVGVHYINHRCCN